MFDDLICTVTCNNLLSLSYVTKVFGDGSKPLIELFNVEDAKRAESLKYGTLPLRAIIN